MLRPACAILLLVAAPGLAAKRDRDPADQGEKASDVSTKMICKKFSDIGSLVSTHRICRTKREWEQARANTGSMNPTNSCATSGQGINC